MVTRTFRLPDELYEKLGGARGTESLNAEVVRRLEASFASGLLKRGSEVEPLGEGQASRDGASESVSPRGLSADRAPASSPSGPKSSVPTPAKLAARKGPVRLGTCEHGVSARGFCEQGCDA